MRKLHFTKRNLAVLLLSAFYVALFYAPKFLIDSKVKSTSPALWVVCCIVAVLPLALELINIFLLRSKKFDLALLIATPIITFAHFCWFAFIVQKMSYFFIAGAPYFLSAFLIALILFLVLKFPKLGKAGKVATSVLLSLATLSYCAFGLFHLGVFAFNEGAVVFALEDEYQIAFSTTTPSIASVTVDGKTYFDHTNGKNNIDKLHKISVPTTALDGAKEYTVSAKKNVTNTGYLAINGKTVTKTFSFRPVDDSDGYQIYELSDVHEITQAPARTASYFGDKLDLLILNGDIVNDISSKWQINIIYRLAHKITKGNLPVVYSRGNHECVGSLANELHKYVGCTERGFYYTLNLGSELSILVLDTGLDLADKHFLTSGVANYDAMRREQAEWLKNLQHYGEGRKYKLTVAHMMYSLGEFTSGTAHWKEFANELVNYTNGITQLCITGHAHVIRYAEAGKWDNQLATYPTLIGSIRHDSVKNCEGVDVNQFTGTAIEIKDGLSVKFTNSKKQVVEEHFITETQLANCLKG